MPDTIIVAVLSLIGTLAGSFGGTQIIKYRLEQLEKKVEKHNSIVERTYLLEEKIKVANHRIEDLEKQVKELSDKVAKEKVAQAAIAGIGTAAALGQVDWRYVVSASVLAGAISILTSIAGIPETPAEETGSSEGE